MKHVNSVETTSPISNPSTLLDEGSPLQTDPNLTPGYPFTYMLFVCSIVKAAHTWGFELIIKDDVV